MFDNVTPKNREVDDIFAETEPTPTPAPAMNRPMANPAPAAAPRPGINLGPQVTPMVNKMPGAPLIPGAEPKSGMAKVIKALIGFIVIVAILGIGGYFVYSKFLSGNVTPQVNIPVNETPKNETPITTPTTTPTSTPIATSTNLEELNALPTSTPTSTATSTLPFAVDTDNDGLTDLEERQYNTNINNIDTDGDGLSDGDEVFVYKSSPLLKDTDADGLSDDQEVKIYMTDPVVFDTDGDTFSDGSEVKNGYNPKGPGKLTK